MLYSSVETLFYELYNAKALPRLPAVAKCNKIIDRKSVV